MIRHVQLVMPLASEEEMEIESELDSDDISDVENAYERSNRISCNE